MRDGDGAQPRTADAHAPARGCAGSRSAAAATGTGCAARSICSAEIALVKTGGPTSTPSRANAAHQRAGECAGAEQASGSAFDQSRASPEVGSRSSISIGRRNTASRAKRRQRRRRSSRGRTPASRSTARARRRAARPRPGRSTRTRCSSANWVALKRRLHRLIRKATKAAVPMPLVMFSLAIDHQQPAVDRRRLGELDEAPVEGRQHRGPAARSRPCTREPPEAEVAEHLQDAEQHQRAPQAEPDHQRAADQRADDRQPQADHLVDDADLGRCCSASPAAGTASAASRRRRRRACRGR